MSETKTKKGVSLNPENVTKQFLTVLLLVLFYILISQIMHIINVRDDSGIPFSPSYRSYTISNQFEKHNNLFFENNWILVPNVSAEDVKNGDFQYSNCFMLPHYEKASISDKVGWRDMGDNVILMGADGDIELHTLCDDEGHRYNYMAYLMKFRIAGDITTLYLSIPDINGEAEIFCNGVYEGKLGDRPDTSSRLDFSCGYTSVPLHADSDGYAEVIICIKADERNFAPGILSNPALTQKDSDTKAIVITSVWFAIILTLTTLFTIGIAIINKTITGNGKLIFLLIYTICFLLYIVSQERYLILDSLARMIFRVCLITVMSIVSYSFVTSLFSDSDYNKKHRFWKYDSHLVALTGLLLLLSQIVLKPIMPRGYHIGSCSIFSFVVSAAMILKILFLYIREKYATFGLLSSTTILFVFVYAHENIMTKYNIPFYSVFFIVAISLVCIFFFVQYVRQYRTLKETLGKMQYLVKEKTLHISEINRDLYNTNKKLMENEEARKNVLSNVSHDLRTPITAIRGYAELLTQAHKTMKPEQVEMYLSNIIKRSQQMERIVSDIVELTRMESNTNEFQFTDVSMAELLDELYMLYEGDLRGTAKKLELDIPEDDLLIVKADPKKISRVFENLISNAINYTYDEALIRVKAWRSDTDKPLEEQRVHIEISDNGIGIPKEEVTKVFDRFYRAKNSGQNIKGTGLGLSIVKTIIEHHDADISVDSRLGSGTTFHIVMKATY